MQGFCGGPEKRALSSPDDDEQDEQDDIPPFNPPNRNITRFPTWPTPSGLTKNKVGEICNKSILYSRAGENCGNVAEVDLDTFVDQCILDIQVSF